MSKEISSHSVRQLIRSSTKGYLSTQLDTSKSKNVELKNSKLLIPYTTFVTIAFDYDVCPIFILSDLSEHTKNLKKNNYVSLLIYEEQKFLEFFAEYVNETQVDALGGYEDPMSRPRLTIVGKLVKYDSLVAKKRFLLRHPASNLYANFADMNLYKLEIINAHITAGFARVKMFDRKELLSEFVDFKEDEFKVVDHMNDEHFESIDLYVKCFFGKGKGWRITGIDSEGFDLRLGLHTLRYYFEKPIKEVSDLRKVFVKLHKKAKSIFN